MPLDKPCYLAAMCICVARAGVRLQTVQGLLRAGGGDHGVRVGVGYVPCDLRFRTGSRFFDLRPGQSTAGPFRVPLVFTLQYTGTVGAGVGAGGSGSQTGAAEVRMGKGLRERASAGERKGAAP